MRAVLGVVDYRVAQKVVHWLMALIIMLDLFVAQKFGGFMAVADRLESRGDHGSLGTILAVLLVVRVALRLIYGAPPLPVGMPQWQIVAAKLGHGLMYFAMLGLVTTGVISALNATDPVMIFQSVTLHIGNLDEDQFQFLRQFHEFFTYLMMALIGVHIVAAGYHHFVAKDDSTRRMLTFWQTQKD
jgi:cytochrome b561